METPFSRAQPLKISEESREPHEACLVEEIWTERMYVEVRVRMYEEWIVENVYLLVLASYYYWVQKKFLLRVLGKTHREIMT